MYSIMLQNDFGMVFSEKCLRVVFGMGGMKKKERR